MRSSDQEGVWLNLTSDIYCSNRSLCLKAQNGRGCRKKLGALLNLLADGTDLRCPQCQSWFHSQNCLNKHLLICAGRQNDEGNRRTVLKRPRVGRSRSDGVDGGDACNLDQVIFPIALSRSILL